MNYPTRSGLYRLLSATSTFVNTKIVLFPYGSIVLTSSVTLLRSASKEPSENNNITLKTCVFLPITKYRMVWSKTPFSGALQNSILADGQRYYD